MVPQAGSDDALTLIVGTDWAYIDPAAARQCPQFVVTEEGRVFLLNFYQRLYGNDSRVKG